MLCACAHNPGWPLRRRPVRRPAVQSGASAFCLGRNATQQDADVVETLFCSVGFCIQVQEKQMDAVTGGWRGAQRGAVGRSGAQRGAAA